jgi:hypothetical protein
MLDDIKGPEDLRGYDADDLRQIADETQSETVKSVAVTGGHLGSGVGVVELTVASHHVFDTPRDRLSWDVRHLACPHKILTGRRDRIHASRAKTGVRSHFIADSGELRSEWFDNVKAVGVTAGASAPELLVQEVVNSLRRLGPVEVATLNGPDETIEFRLPPELASVSSLPRLATALARPLSQG